MFVFLFSSNRLTRTFQGPALDFCRSGMLFGRTCCDGGIIFLSVGKGRGGVDGGKGRHARPLQKCLILKIEPLLVSSYVCIELLACRLHGLELLFHNQSGSLAATSMPVAVKTRLDQISRHKLCTVCCTVWSLSSWICHFSAWLRSCMSSSAHMEPPTQLEASLPESGNLAPRIVTQVQLHLYSAYLG